MLAADRHIRRFVYEPEEPENTQEEVLNLGYWDNWDLTNLKDSDMIGAELEHMFYY
jgi:hypothetical protein